MARHCGHCYGRGHNRRSCPEIRREIRDNPDGYQARIERQKKEQQSRNPRRCSYCKTTGHNKKTCQKLKNDRLDVALDNRKWRREFLDCARTNGFTVGTLLQFIELTDGPEMNDWRRERIQGLITKHGNYGVVIGFVNEALDKRQKQRSYAATRVRFPSGKTLKMMLPVSFAGLMDQYAEPNMKIVGKLNAENIDKQFDYGWHNGTDTADYHLNV